MKTKSHKRMFVAIAENDLKAVKQMTEAGFPHDSLWYHGRTSLHLAIEERKKKVVEFLLESGVNPSTRDHRPPGRRHAAPFGRERGLCRLCQTAAGLRRRYYGKGQV